MTNPLLPLRTLLNEIVIAVGTGLLTFVLSVLLAPGSMAAAVGFALVAGTAAGALDTLFFHLLFRLRHAPVYEAEQRYRHALEDTHQRLLDGSIQLREALILRSEADYQRTAVITRPEGRSKRQLREARRRLKARLWVVEHLISADQLGAASVEAKSDPTTLERWTERTDRMVDAYLQVRRRQGFGAAFTNRFGPGRLAAQVRGEWEKLPAAA